jgi:hypothetical protein
MDEAPSINMILMVLIGVVYGIGAVIKKIDRWIQVHRMPREMRPGQEQPAPPPPETPDPRETEPQAAAQPTPSEAGAILMRELQKALGVPEQAQQKPEQPVSPPEKKLPVEQPPKRAEHAAPAIRRTTDGRRITSTGIVVEEAARVVEKDMSHLAILRTPEDLKRAVLLHEILSPPRSLRRLTPRQAVHSPSR